MGRQVPAPRRLPGAANVERRRAVNASTIVTTSDELISVDTTAGNVDLTLPAANTVPAGTVFEAVRTAGVNAMRWVPPATDSINGGGAGVQFSMSKRLIVSCRIVSDGVSAWRTLETDSSGVVSTTAIIPLGAATVDTGDFGLGTLVNARIVCQIRQAAFDGTLTAVQAFGNANGTVTVNGNANATAAVTVAVFVDNRT